MRKVIDAAFVSLDGVMQAPGGPQEDPTGGFTLGGWTVNYWDETMGEVMDKIFSEPFDLLLGRKTYEIFAAYWPYAGSDPIGEKFNAVTKYVATSSNEPLTWQNSVAIHDVVEEVGRLKKQDGPNLLLQGSGNLIQTLLANDLIDEFNLLTFPVLLGRGKRLFGQGTMPAGLQLVDTKTSTTGVVMTSYLRSGPVSTGSFAHNEISAAEQARREKMAREDQ
jgi:dihydrofolate reductase